MKVEGRQAQKCPFIGDWCDKNALENCAMATTLTKRGAGGMMQKQVCIFMALGEVLSEINQKTVASPQPEVPQIILPFGRG